MVFLCILVGILEFVVGITWLISFHSTFAYVGIGIGYIVTGLIMFYIAYLGATHVTKEQYDEDIKNLQIELNEANNKIDAILRNANDPELEKAVQRDSVRRKSRTSLENMELGFPVILLKDKNNNEMCIPAGTKGNFQERKGEFYKIRFVIEHKGYIAYCRADEIENFYAHEMKQEKGNSAEKSYK